MRQGVTGIVGCMALLLALFGTAAADDPDCPAPGLFVVDTLAEAAIVANGFNCPQVDLEVRFNLSAGPVPPGVGPGPGVSQKLQITVNSFLCESPNPADPSLKIQIVNDNPSSEVFITAKGVSPTNPPVAIQTNGCSIKAHKILKLTCTAPGCTFKSDFSDLIAAADFSNPQGGGGLFLNIKGPIDIHTTNVHGGDTLEVESVDSSITLICVRGDIGCKDPNQAPIPQIILDQCEDPANPGQILFPCNAVFQNAQQLRDVCFGEIGVECNGGHKEKRFTAGTFIDFTGSTITSFEHVTFTCKGLGFPGIPDSGDLKASGATFLFDSLVINCKGKVDLSNATVTMVKNLSVNVGANCPVPSPVGQPCVDLSGAKITAKPLIVTAHAGQSTIDACDATFIVLPGISFPKLNNDPSPPYDTNVLDTSAECAGLPAKFCNDSFPPPNSCKTN